MEQEMQEEENGSSFDLSETVKPFQINSTACQWKSLV